VPLQSSLLAIMLAREARLNLISHAAAASLHRSADADGRDVRTSIDRSRLPVALTAGEVGQNQAAAR
jgi:hypothetical protein